MFHFCRLIFFQQTPSNTPKTNLIMRKPYQLPLFVGLLLSLGLVVLLQSSNTPQPQSAKPSSPSGNADNNGFSSPASVPHPETIQWFKQNDLPLPETTPIAKTRVLPESDLLPARRAFRSNHQRPPRNQKLKNRQIWLRNRTIQVSSSQTASTAFPTNSLTRRQTTPAIVQFHQPISPALREKVTQTGARLLHYLPNNAFLAELDASAWQSLRQNDEVAYLAPLQPADKTDPFLSHLQNRFAPSDRIQISVQPLHKEDITFLTAFIKHIGGSLKATQRSGLFGQIRAELPLAAIDLLANHASVQWIEEFITPEFHNDVATRDRFLNVNQARDNWNLTGLGQIIGHADSGLSTGDLATLHPDFHGRVLAQLSYTAPSTRDLIGHGTHTAGSILGDGTASNGQYRGAAPEALLVTQSLAGTTASSRIYPPEFSELLGVPYAEYGARIHSNSWGANAFGTYTMEAQMADWFLWEHPRLLTVFSAGNAGNDLNSDGVIDPYSLGSPAVAKNILAVGAAESERPPSSEGYRGVTAAGFFPEIPEPLHSDYLSSSRSPDGNLQGMAVFSSRGPAQDGRTKPDIVAPGTNIVSPFSSESSARSWGLLMANPAYAYMGGTSMACPLISGSAALVRQYLTQRAGITEPSSALLRAALLGGARSLAPGQFGTGPFKEIPSRSPNSVEGWGQANVLNTVHPSGQMIRLIDDLTLHQGQTQSFTVDILNPDQSFDVALAWIDYPSALQAASPLVNDFDLSVTTPAGEQLHSNGGTSPDQVNNNEVIRIPHAEQGTYTVAITAARLPYPRGSAALYLRGAFDAPEIIVHTAPEFIEPAPDHLYPVQFRVQSLNPLDAGQVEVVWSVDQLSWQSSPASYQGDAAYKALLPIPPEASDFSYHIVTTNQNRLTRLPAEEDRHFHCRIAAPVQLTVSGSPEQRSVVKPFYGEHQFFSGQTVSAKAFSFQNQTEQTKYRCTGWTGSGSLPAKGDSSAFEFTITADSSLTWLWEADQFKVTVGFRTSNAVVSDYFNHEAWVGAGDSFSFDKILGRFPLWMLLPNFPAQEYDNHVAFAGWELNGHRWPDDTSPSPLYLEEIPINEPHSFSALFLDEEQDLNEDGLPDFFPLRYFGQISAHAAAKADPDNDGWNNYHEFLDGTDPTDPAGVPAPPEITIPASNDTQQDTHTWTLLAHVFDSNVSMVEITWWEEGADNPVTAPMQWAGEHTFTFAFQPPSQGRLPVHYSVTAYDPLAEEAIYPPASSEVRTTGAAFVPPQLAASLQNESVVAAGDTADSQPLTINNLVAENLSASLSWLTPLPGPFGQIDRFSQNTSPPLWVRTSLRTPHNRDSSVWYCGDPDAQLYGNNLNAALDTPDFTVPENAAFFFRHWLDAEMASAPYFWDGAFLQISTDQGESFQSITPQKGYPHVISATFDDSNEGPVPAFGTTNGQWQPVILNLADFAGQTVRIRFLFRSDMAISREGWYVTGMALLGPSPTPPVWASLEGPEALEMEPGSSTEITLHLLPNQLPINETGLAAIAVGSPDRTDHLIPVTLIHAHSLATTAHGNGSISPPSAVFLHDNLIECLVQADPGFVIQKVQINGFERSQSDALGQTSAVIPFTNAYIDQSLEVWFAEEPWNLTIASQRGQSLPAAGSYEHQQGQTVTVAMTTPILFEGPTTRHVCIGYRLSPDGPLQTTTDNTVDLLMDRDRSFSWVWETQHLVSTMTQGKGSVSPQAQWIPAETVGALSATPHPAYTFSHWLGDVEPSTQFADKLVFPVSQPRSLLAAFSQFATENKLVPFSWLDQFPLGNDREAVVDQDPDGDGFTVAEEYQADTDPTDPASFLRLRASRFDDQWLLLQWNAAPHRSYSIRESSNLKDFSELQSLSFPENSVFVPSPQPGETPKIFSLEASVDQN